MDKFSAEFRKMLHGGADPRRVMPGRRLLPVVKDEFRSGLFAILGFFACGLSIVISAIAFEMRPASLADIRLVSIVRSSIPEADSLPVRELVGRLAAPSGAGDIIATVVDAPVTTNWPWLSKLNSHIYLAIDPGRVAALTNLVRRLAATPSDSRSEWLDQLMELDRALQDSDVNDILTIVANLPREQRRELAKSQTFR